MSSTKGSTVATAADLVKIPKSYADLVKAFRALLKKCEAAEKGAETWEGEAKNWYKTCEHRLAECQEFAETIERVIGERDLALNGKAGAEKREEAAVEYGRELAESEGQLRGQVQYLERRLQWADNARHEMGHRFYMFALDKGVKLEELQALFPELHIDHRGTVA